MEMELPERYRELSVTGRVRVERHGGAASVAFRVDKGIMADRAWLVYTTSPERLQRAYRIRWAEDHWYYARQAEDWKTPGKMLPP